MQELPNPLGSDLPLSGCSIFGTRAGTPEGCRSLLRSLSRGCTVQGRVEDLVGRGFLQDDTRLACSNLIVLISTKPESLQSYSRERIAIVADAWCNGRQVFGGACEMQGSLMQRLDPCCILVCSQVAGRQGSSDMSMS